MKLFYRTQGDGYPVILLHGLFGASENLGMVARPLAEHFKVVSVDLRNHGRSPHHPTMDYPSMASDVLRLAESLDTTKCHILGHSMGGKVAMQMAFTEPERVTKLIVADIAPMHYPPHHSDVLEALSHLDKKAISSREQANELVAHFIDDPGVRMFLLSNLKRNQDKSYGLRLNLDALLNNQRQLSAALDGQPYNGPALFIRGENSDYIKDAYRADIDRLFTRNRLATLENAGHWLHADQTAAFNDAVLNFLNGNN